MRTLFIIRGLPGSGKTTLAKMLVGEDRYAEADMFMVDEHKRYCYDADRLKEAHARCFNLVTEFMENMIGSPERPCAVSNTFTRRWEYQEYIKLANRHKYEVQVIDCHGRWKSEHNVPEDKMEAMRNRWEPHKW